MSARKACTGCHRPLPIEAFPSAGRRGKEPTCAMCTNDARRLRTPLPALKPDPELIRLSNVTNLWFGPVRREPMRSIA
ncbi:hypothetical protein [Stenotrophomonas rhizophila]|uniref:hypothetical protein n=1 Tax=Stenotrophomonas rhizophila TaxID=216778 RepID=UPI00112F32BD|nr:hypothetical protein [Stenotrophomonas rhizophila]